MRINVKSTLMKKSRFGMKMYEEMTEAEKEAEVESVRRGVCLHLPELGHVHIGEPTPGKRFVPMWIMASDGDSGHSCTALVYFGA